MKRYSFRLANVLRIRRAEEVRDRDQLLTARSRLRELLEARDQELARYEALSVEPVGTTFEAFHSNQLALELAARTLARAERHVTQAAADAALAQVAWLAASRKVAVIERLDERRRHEHSEDERRADGQLVDDLTTTRFVLEQFAGQFEATS